MNKYDNVSAEFYNEYKHLWVTEMDNGIQAVGVAAGPTLMVYTADDSVWDKLPEEYMGVKVNKQVCGLVSPA